MDPGVAGLDVQTDPWRQHQAHAQRPGTTEHEGRSQVRRGWKGDRASDGAGKEHPGSKAQVQRTACERRARGQVMGMRRADLQARLV